MSRGWRSAAGFLTTLGGAAELSPAAVPWFAPVGAVVGTVVGVTWWAASQVVPPAVAAGLALVIDAALTGLLHLDGLADTADGLLASVNRERSLEIMRKPDVGAFGVVALVLVIGLRWAALTALAPHVGLIAGLWAGSRTLMAGALGLLPAARPDGLTIPFRSRSGAARSLLIGLALMIVLASTASWPGLLAAAGGLVMGGVVLSVAQRRLGGQTGDVLGAAGVMVETAGLVVATVWR